MLKNYFVLTLLVASLYADDQSDILDLLQGDMQKYSKIATDTKQNVDYMPYVVSVLKNEELTKLGILSLREALTLVPGVDVSVGMAGVKNPIFRGSNPFAMGQSKLIIDGVVVNDQMFGAYNQYLEMPIDIIERIEVVRGPGSLLSSVNAYAGSIHVITKANKDDGLEKDNNIFAAFGSDEYMMGGFVASHKEGDLELTSDLFYQRHDKELSTGPDRFGNSGEAPLWLKNYALGLNVNYKDLYVKGRFSKNDSGVSYGQSFSLSDDSSDYLDVMNNSLEVGYGFDIAKGVKGTLSVGYFDEWRELQNKVMPDGSSMGMMTFPNGVYFLVNYTEQTFKERFEVEITALDNHKITAGVMLSQSRIKDNTAKQSMNDLQSFMNEKDLLSNSRREHSSYYIDDLIDINEHTSVQLGAKFDHYSDVKDQFSPRLAVVHRYDDENIYKLMYTRSYREPSWREQYLVGAHYFNADPNVQEESVDAYEAAYIRKFGIKNDIKFNAFYLKNKDQIHAQDTPRVFTNRGDNELYGLETELKTQLRESDQFYLNYSYVDGSNVSGSLANSAQHMARAYYIYNMTEHLSLSPLIKYVGEKGRVQADTREDVDDYLTADVSAVYTYEPSDLTVSMSVKNLFDTTYYLPSPDNTYPGDFKQEGISFLLRLEKRF